MPVNAFGDEWMAVVGESHHVQELDLVTGGGTGELELVANLVREPENPYDPDAVAVVVQGSRVGYLSRENAARFAAGLDAVGGRATCGAVIRRRDPARSWNVVLQVDYATLDSL